MFICRLGPAWSTKKLPHKEFLKRTLPPAGKELNARRSSKQLEAAAAAPAAAPSGRSGEKFRALKAREAARKAASEVRLPALGAVGAVGARPGAGLGLGWVRWYVSAHGGVEGG